MKLLDRIFGKDKDDGVKNAEIILDQTREMVRENRQARRELAELTGNIVRDQMVLGTNVPRLEGDFSDAR